VDHKSVAAFLDAEPKPSWDGEELLIMSKEAYVEMKIKEKGLKGKAAIVKRDHITRKGFNAFREMRMAAGGRGGKKEAERAESEIFVAFLGKKIRVSMENGGSVAPEDVPHMHGSALRFTGCGGEVSYDDIKRPLKERFSRAPFVKFTKGEDTGLVGFDKALDTEDIAFVEDKIPTLNGKPVTWEIPEGSSSQHHAFPFRTLGNQLITFPLCRRGRTRICDRAGQRGGEARIGGRGRRSSGRS
jgi:lupus La protein